MRRLALTMLLALGPVAPAVAQDAGGASAPGDTFETGSAGGTRPGAGSAPVARLSASVAGGVPRIAVRFAGATAVQARVVVLRAPGNAVVARVPLGRVAADTTVTVPWRGGALPAGRYVVRVHGRDDFSHQLSRPRSAPGKLTLTVRAAPATPAADPAPPPTSRGIFPLRGAFTYGSPFGEDRGSYAHQGQDMAAAAGTPVVAPLGGTIATANYQASGAGYYVVLNASNGHSYFFAHCQQGSIPVATGDTVAAGDPLCRVGSTGRSTGPHLHFEEWVDGWRTGSRSRPIDPRPQLNAWAS